MPSNFSQHEQPTLETLQKETVQLGTIQKEAAQYGSLCKETEHIGKLQNGGVEIKATKCYRKISNANRGFLIQLVIEQAPSARLSASKRVQSADEF
jgi:hypothetical protein